MPPLPDDLRYAARGLRKTPGFTAVAVLTLALGVGANTAVFSLLNAVLLRPLPYHQPERLVLIWESAPFFGLRDSPVSPANYVDWKARSRSFEQMGALEDRSYRLVGEAAPEIVEGALATASLFRTLATRPAMGRVFSEQEDQPGAPKVAVISDGFWRRRFSADPAILGKNLTLNDENHTIIGVLAPGTEPPSEYRSKLGEIWTPFGSSYKPDAWANRGRHNWMVVARLREGISLARADAEMQAIGASLAREYPETNSKVGAFVAPLREHFVSSSRRMLLVLLGTVALVLLIACSNLANLLLSRAANRSKEVAVRAALGAGRWQLARQFLCESLLLCTLGSGLGLLLATTTFRFLVHLAPARVSVLNDLSLDWRVLAFTLAIALGTAMVFGLIPLLQVRRLELVNALKQGGKALAAGSGSRRVRALLISTEVALAFVLLIGAGLLLETFARLRGVEVGFRTSNILTLNVPVTKAHTGSGRIAYQREVLRRVAGIPGVLSAGFTNHIPIAFKGDVNGIFTDGRPEPLQCRARAAGPGYLRAMGMRLLRGRDIQETDDEAAPRVALVNETLARKLWPGQDPVGRALVFGRGGERRVQVVGVVGDIHQVGLDVPPSPEYYISTLQDSNRATSLAIHTRIAPGSLAAAVRRAIWSVDPEQPITEGATMEEILDREVFPRRVQTTVLAAFAGLALVLAAIGLYGVLSYLVGQQISEIGLRMALGAEPGDILRGVVGRGLRLTAIGVAMGWPAALAASRLLNSVLFGVSHNNTATYAAVAAVLLATSTVASYLPARRAMRVDPMVALRAE